MDVLNCRHNVEGGISSTENEPVGGGCNLVEIESPKGQSLLFIRCFSLLLRKKVSLTEEAIKIIYMFLFKRNGCAIAETLEQVN